MAPAYIKRLVAEISLPPSATPPRQYNRPDRDNLRFRLSLARPRRLQHPDPARYDKSYDIALGHLTILEGDPGMGKSWLTCALAASVSMGGGLPGLDSFAPGSVLISRPFRCF